MAKDGYWVERSSDEEDERKRGRKRKLKNSSNGLYLLYRCISGLFIYPWPDLLFLRVPASGGLLEQCYHNALYFADLVVEGKFILELKSVKKLTDTHRAPAAVAAYGCVALA